MTMPDVIYAMPNRMYAVSHSPEYEEKKYGVEKYYSQSKVDELLERQRDCYSEICDRLASMMEQGAGELQPGERLRQAARMIRNAKIGDSDD